MYKYALAQAIRNRIGELQGLILRAEGEIDGLAKVLVQLESGPILAGEPPAAGGVSDSSSFGDASPKQIEGAGSGESGGGSPSAEGGAAGADGSPA